MNTTARTHRMIVATAVAIITLAATPTAANADAGVQTQIDAYLHHTPGGVQINANELSYNQGAIIITFKKPDRGSTTTFGPDCPYDYFCLYESVNYVYPRARLQACGWQDLFPTWYDRADSIAYNLPYGSVDFINHLGVGHSADVTLFTLDANKRSVVDVKPYRNSIDHVRRNC